MLNSYDKDTISITTCQVEDTVQIRIADTGTGMPKDILEKIFDPFFTTKTVEQGTGQGLSIAHGVIVDTHKGTLHVDSTVGQGTEFTITLPTTITTDRENPVSLWEKHNRVSEKKDSAQSIDRFSTRMSPLRHTKPQGISLLNSHLRVIASLPVQHSNQKNRSGLEPARN